MARFAGKGGTATFGGSAVFACKDWECDYKGDAIDVTGMDSSGAKEFIAGLTEWSATVNGFATGALSTIVPGTTVALVLRGAAAADGDVPNWTGSAIVTGLKVSTAVDGAVEVGCTLQGTGALTAGIA